MKKIALLALATLLTSISVKAELVETKFKVSARYFDENGEMRKLINTRAFIRYDNEADLLSNSAKSDCLVISGKKDIASVFTEVDKDSCISNKTYVITSKDIIVDMIYRPTIFSFFHDDIARVYNILIDDGVIISKTSNDQGTLGSIRAFLRNSLVNAVDVHTISLVGETEFTLKGDGKAKFVIDLEPISTKFLK